jgi:pilus assembly protein CpaF
MAGHIISIIGGKGGVGKSQLAANLAFAYAGELRQKVMLLDFDQKACGDQSIITGMKMKKTLKDLSEFNGSVDPRTMMSFVTPHKAGIHFVGMPSDPTLADAVDTEGLGKTLKALPSLYPITIIDAGSELNELALKALEYSTLIIMVVNQDILAVNQTKRMYSDLVTMLFPKEMMQIVVNQSQKGHPVSPEVIGRQIGKPVFGMVPKDDQTCISSLQKSMPAVLAQRNSAFSKGVLEVIRKLNQKNVLKTLERLKKPEGASASKKSTENIGKGGKNPWLELKSRIHKSLVEEMDMKKQDENDPKAKIILREKTKKLVVELLGKEDTKTVLKSREDMNRIVKEILDEALGLGPLEDMLADKSISEIMVVGPDKIFFEQSW